MSIASQATQQKFPFRYEAVFDGLAIIIPSAGMSIKSKDKIIGRITASAGISLLSWGENLTFVVEKIDDNSTIVGIESSLKFGANLTGAHRHQKNFDKIIAALSHWLQKNIPNITSSVSIVDQRKCPFCAELIKSEAVVCRYCNRDVPTFSETVEAVTNEAESKLSEKQKSLDNENSTTVELNNTLNNKFKLKITAIIIGTIIVIAIYFISNKQTEQRNIETKNQLDIEEIENSKRWLQSAKTLIESNSKGYSELSRAKTNLETIDAFKPEYKEAQKILPVIIKRMVGVKDVKEGKEAKVERELYTLGGKRIHAKHPNWSPGVCNTIAKKKINIGMNTEQVAAAWGRPYDINRTTGSFGSHEQWVMHEMGSSYVYFENGVCTAIQN